MSQAHFDIDTVIDRTVKQKGTVTIDRDKGTVTVRAKGSHKVYEMQLEEVVTMVVQTVARREVAANSPPRRRRFAKRGLLTMGT